MTWVFFITVACFWLVPPAFYWGAILGSMVFSALIAGVQAQQLPAAQSDVPPMSAGVKRIGVTALVFALFFFFLTFVVTSSSVTAMERRRFGGVLSVVTNGAAQVEVRYTPGTDPSLAGALARKIAGYEAGTMVGTGDVFVLHADENDFELGFTVPDSAWNIEGTRAFYARWTMALAETIERTPTKCRLLDRHDGECRAEITVAQFAPFGGSVTLPGVPIDVEPRGSVSDTEARELCKQLGAAGYARTDGQRCGVAFQRRLVREAGKVAEPARLGPATLTCFVEDGTWDDAKYLEYYQGIVRKCVTAMGGFPVTLEITGTAGKVEKSIIVHK